MSYRWLKWLILWIPTLTIGLWEYVRHAFLLPYISMDLGNVLAPVLVFIVTLTLLRGLFKRLELMQDALQRERLSKSSFEQREKLARELHDGISQSLFLLSVKLDSLEHAHTPEGVRQTTEQIRGTVRHVYEDVRQSIANLKSSTAASPAEGPWLTAIHSLAEELRAAGGGYTAEVNWQLPEHALSDKEKVELMAIVREALMNVRKHTHEAHVSIACYPLEGGAWGSFHCIVADTGRGADAEQLEAKGRYGIRMMRERAKQMGWSLRVKSERDLGTRVEIATEPLSDI
ncbi:two-component system, NarL family, nitrate/nitrite sensor histidine kinase NarQ [Paenibacillus algorifonticola]|uniref:histidine kinase n=1 Tax=Paenibacillus algorifonticola TaxID=684063 RepID=A0A1I2G3M0_9BACL|nr:histidine kinase [Paenibacillus algorifonticola]SFF12235.1 two-component system, NarL family, nitrate/nitrite sensor histidine kinase NarQ [Paenibacillus algorifonticola]